MKNVQIKIVNQKKMFVATQSFWDESIFYNELKNRNLNPHDFFFCWENNKLIKEPDTFDSILKNYQALENPKTLIIHLRKKAKSCQSIKTQLKSNVSPKVMQQTKPSKVMNKQKKPNQSIPQVPEKKQQLQQNKQSTKTSSTKSLDQKSSHKQTQQAEITEIKQNALKIAKMLRVSKHHYQPIYDKQITNEKIQKIINQSSSQESIQSDFQYQSDDEKFVISKKQEHSLKEKQKNAVVKEQLTSQVKLDVQKSETAFSLNLDSMNGISEIKCYSCFDKASKQGCLICKQKGYLPKENSYFLYINGLLQKERSQTAKVWQTIQEYIQNKTL